jgi:hypothetical protein
VKVEVFVSGQLVVHAGILEDDAEPLADLVLMRHRIEAVDLHFAGGGPQQRGEHLDGGGLSGAVGAKKRKDLAFADIEGNVSHGLNFAELLDKVLSAYHRGFNSLLVFAPLRLGVQSKRPPLFEDDIDGDARAGQAR